MQGCPARHEDRQARARCEHISDERSSLQDLFEIVEHEQDVLVAQESTHLLGRLGGSLFAQPECLGDHPWNEGGIADGSQFYEHHAISEPIGEVLSDLECEPCLADTTQSCQGEQAHIAATQQGKCMRTFLFTTNDSRRRKRESMRGGTCRSINKGSNLWSCSGQEQVTLLG